MNRFVDPEHGTTIHAASGDPPTSQSPSWWRATWERWKQTAHAVGVVQTRFLMILFYVVFVVPLGLLIGRRHDRLRLKPPAGSLWLPHQEHESSLESARRQS